MVRVGDRRQSTAHLPFPLTLAWDGTDVLGYGSRDGRVVGTTLDGRQTHQLALRTASAVAVVGPSGQIVVAGADQEGKPALAAGDLLIRLPDEDRMTAWPVLAASANRVAVAWGTAGRVVTGWCDGGRFSRLATVDVNADLDHVAIAVVDGDVVVLYSFLSVPGVVIAQIDPGGQPALSRHISEMKPASIWLQPGGRAVWMTPDHRRLLIAEVGELSLPGDQVAVTAQLLGDDLIVWVVSDPVDGSVAWAAPIDLETPWIGEPVRISSGRLGIAAVVTGRSTAVVAQDGSPPIVSELEVL